MPNDLGKVEHRQMKYEVFEISLSLSKSAEYLQ